MEIHVGLAASYVALALGGLYFVYALKYYASTLIALSLMNPEGQLQGMVIQPEDIGLDYPDQPMVSVHLPFYNEANVARRIIDACIDLDYGNYEVLVADDSRDQTLDVLRDPEYRVSRPTVKFIHRKDRGGFKGGALQQALTHMHPDVEYVAVFDADFIPPPDIIHKFLSVFERAGDARKPVAAVQGYQLHYLNTYRRKSSHKGKVGWWPPCLLHVEQT